MIILLAWNIPKKMPFLIGMIAIVMVIWLGIYFWQKKRKQREKERHALRRMREEALDRALANPAQECSPEIPEIQRRPFQVEYSRGDSGQKQKNADRMFQLTEITELSQRKYMFRCNELISIGNQFGNTTILTDTTESKQIYCQIFFYKGANYVRSIGRKEIFLKRKDKKVMVNDLGIKLLSKDSFRVNQTTFQIDFL